jgi:hypothetical protein
MDRKLLNVVSVLYGEPMEKKIGECCDSNYGVLMDRKLFNVVRVLYGVLMDRKIVEVCDSTVQCTDE